MLKLKKKDTVIVLAGRDKGKKGEIKEITGARKVTVMGIDRKSTRLNSSHRL